MASEENQRNGFPRVSRARNAEMRRLEEEMRTLLAEDEELLHANETAEREIDEIELAIRAEEAKISELNSMEVNLQHNTRKNKLIIDAYQQTLAPDTTEYQALQDEVNWCIKNTTCDDETWAKMVEKKNMLDEKEKLQMENKELDYQIESVLEMKLKEMYPHQSR